MIRKLTNNIKYKPAQQENIMNLGGLPSAIPFLSNPSCLAAPWCLTISYRLCLGIRDHGLLVPSFGVEFHLPKKKESDHSMGFFLFVGRVPKINFYIINTKRCIPTDIFCCGISSEQKAIYILGNGDRFKLKTKALKIRLQGIKVGGRERFEKSCCLKSHLGYFLSFTGRLSRLELLFLRNHQALLKINVLNGWNLFLIGSEQSWSPKWACLIVACSRNASKITDRK